jgi:hypothetical protein
MADGSNARLPSSTETILGHVSSVSSFGSLGGPIVCADRIGNLGLNGETVTVTLETHREVTVGDKTIHDHVVVAHLRMPTHTMLSLKDAIQQIVLMTKPPVGVQNN